MNRNMETLQEFNRKKNMKALGYTASICALLFLLFILISWKTEPPAPPLVQDLLEVNLGNDAEGFGEEQPLIKGEMGPNENIVALPQTAQQAEEVSADMDAADDDNDVEAAPIPKTIKTAILKPANKINTPNAIPKPVTKPNTVTNSTVTKAPPKPKYAYNGPGAGTGNGADRDNGYTQQGNKPGGKGDAGTPTGNPDSYGKNPGGKIGGPLVIRGNRKIVKYPSFESDLAKATIYADVNVSADGTGTFIKLVKPSTSFNGEYATRIKSFLKSIKFNAASSATEVTVKFNFTIQ